MSLLNSDQAAKLNNLAPSLAAAGIALGDIINALYEETTNGNIGITAGAADVDSVCKGDGPVTINHASTTGLDLYFNAGRTLFAGTVVDVAAGHVTLTGSATNYVEIGSDGTVSAHTAPAAFTAGRIPLCTITTTTEIPKVNGKVTFTNKRVLLGTIQPGGVVGSLLSTAARTKELTLGPKTVGQASSPVKVRLRMPNIAGTITKISALPAANLAASDATYWKWGCINKGAAGAGTTVVVDDTAAANSTKATGGAALAVNVPREMTLTATAEDLAFAAGDVLEITFTANGAVADLADLVLMVEGTFVG